MERSIRYNFWIDLESIQHKLLSDYGLNIYFSCCFPYIDGPSFSPYKPSQHVDFSKVGNRQSFFRNCTHILTGTQGGKFEDMFLVKIARKGTSLRNSYFTTIWKLFSKIFIRSGKYASCRAQFRYFQIK